MVLPTNWFSLSDPEQLFVLADLERTARGLPPYLGLNAHLTAEAQLAASDDTDPSLATGFAVAPTHEGAPRMGGTWASGITTLGADFLWMYADGWGGTPAGTPNTACTSPSAAGCWAHRDELLGVDPRFNRGRRASTARTARWVRASRYAAAPGPTSTSSSARRTARRP